MFGLLDFKKSFPKATYQISHQILKRTSKLSEWKHLIIVSIPSHQQIQV